MEHKVDAKGKRLGRLATEVAVLLMGKDRPDYARNTVADVHVHVSNIAELDIPAKKLLEKKYLRYSGYPGGQKVETLDKVIKNKGHEEVFRMAVKGMLPSNKLRPLIMKRLQIS